MSTEGYRDDPSPPQFSRPRVSPSIVEDRRKLDFATELAAFAGWYHSMKFPDGEIIEGYLPLSLLQERYADFGLPEDRMAAFQSGQADRLEIPS